MVHEAAQPKAKQNTMRNLKAKREEMLKQQQAAAATAAKPSDSVDP